jgi:hypothetical protein
MTSFADFRGSLQTCVPWNLPTQLRRTSSTFAVNTCLLISAMAALFTRRRQKHADASFAGLSRIACMFVFVINVFQIRDKELRQKRETLEQGGATYKPTQQELADQARVCNFVLWIY